MNQESVNQVSGANTLYRVEYQRDGQFQYSEYIRMALSDVEYNARLHVAHFPGQTFVITPAIE